MCTSKLTEWGESACVCVGVLERNVVQYKSISFMLKPDCLHKPGIQDGNPTVTSMLKMNIQMQFVVPINDSSVYELTFNKIRQTP